MLNEGQFELRRIYAGICLLVVVLLYAPLAGAAWTLYQSSCCKSGQCSIAAHHHQKAAPAAPASPMKHMDCGHEHEMSGMMACAMSCCHDPDRSLITPVAFVLPPTGVVAESFETNSAVTFATPNSSRSIEPASPPPRSPRTAV